LAYVHHRRAWPETLRRRAALFRQAGLLAHFGIAAVSPRLSGGAVGFLYRDPVEVLVSQLRIPGTQMLPGGIGPNLYGIERSYGPGTAEDYYARVLAKVTEPAAAQYFEGGGLLVNYRQLPDALFTAILPHFGVACGEADRTAMMEAARYDAKTPGFEFEPDSGAKQQAATPTARAAADRWLGELYRRLEVLRAHN
jgi:hypothetical protein